MCIARNIYSAFKIFLCSSTWKKILHPAERLAKWSLGSFQDSRKSNVNVLIVMSFIMNYVYFRTMSTQWEGLIICEEVSKLKLMMSKQKMSAFKSIIIKKLFEFLAVYRKKSYSLDWNIINSSNHLWWVQKKKLQLLKQRTSVMKMRYFNRSTSH